jgi:hypothetical protein
MTKSNTRFLEMLCCLSALEVLDAGLTLFLLQHGAVELNPLLHSILSYGPVWFVLYKLGLSGLCVVLLWSLRGRVGGLFWMVGAVVLVMVAVVLIQLFMVSQVLG